MEKFFWVVIMEWSTNCTSPLDSVLAVCLSKSIGHQSLVMPAYKGAVVMVLSELVDLDDKKLRRGKTREWIKRRRESGYFQPSRQKDMYKMSYQHKQDACQDILQMPKRCLKRKSERHVCKTSWRGLGKIYRRCLTEDMLKMSY